jgi:hypothetical protein
MIRYNKAKLRIWNPEAYPSAEVRQAAVYILGSFRASSEDIAQASSLL